MVSGDNESGGEQRAEKLDAKAAIERLQGDERYAANAVIDRLKECLGCDSDSELAWILNTNRQNIWKWRTRNSVPYREAVFLALWARLSLDYLLTGRGSARFEDGQDTIDKLLLQGVLEKAFRAYKSGQHRSGDFAVRVMAAYDKADSIMRRLIDDEGVKPETARGAALGAIEALGFT